MTRLCILLFALVFDSTAWALTPSYTIGVSSGASSSIQNVSGASPKTAFAFGLSGDYSFANSWAVGAELVSSKPIESVRTTSYLASLEYRLNHWNFGGLLGLQAQIDDRADVSYIDPFTGRPVKKSDYGFSYGLRVDYDFIIPLSSDSSDLAIAPGVRYLQGTGASSFNQFYFLLEFKMLSYREGKEKKE